MFLISSIGQNWKLGNLENGHFFFLNHRKVKVFFVLGHFYGF